MKRKHLYLSFALILLAVRLYINFRTPLISGINGAYYFVQVRSILDGNMLAFADMPLYFYLNAFLVKIVSFFSSATIESLIVTVVKLSDSFFIGLLVLPLYWLAGLFIKEDKVTSLEVVLVAFACLSFAPVFLTSDLQKNSFALPFMTFSLYYFFKFIQSKSIKDIILLSTFLLITGLSHFGVFSVTLFMVLIGLMVEYKWKAILPAVLLGGLGLVLIFIFDPVRAERLLNIGAILFGHPMFLAPPNLLNLILYSLPAGIGLSIVYKWRHSLSHLQKTAILTLSISLILLFFPMLDMQYTGRFSLIAFLPLVVLFFAMQNQLSKGWMWVSKIGFSLVIVGTLLMTFVNPRNPTLTDEAYGDLQEIKTTLEDPDNTLIIARHGLEWWVAWELETKAGQAMALASEDFAKYDQVLSLVPLNEKNHMFPPGPGPRNGKGVMPPQFTAVPNPDGNDVLYESDHFKLVELTEKDIPEKK
ncbi:MAG: hypothetical protein AAFO07_25255 [Bacteroidota bacterium]